MQWFCGVLCLRKYVIVQMRKFCLAKISKRCLYRDPLANFIFNTLLKSSRCKSCSHRWTGCGSASKQDKVNSLAKLSHTAELQCMLASTLVHWFINLLKHPKQYYNSLETKACFLFPYRLILKGFCNAFSHLSYPNFNRWTGQAYCVKWPLCRIFHTREPPCRFHCEYQCHDYIPRSRMSQWLEWSCNIEANCSQDVNDNIFRNELNGIKEWQNDRRYKKDNPKIDDPPRGFGWL